MTLISVVKDEPVVKFSDLKKAIDQRLGRNIRDFEGSHAHFYKWCDLRGYGEKDPDNQPHNASQIWAKEYASAPDGEVMCPLYRDFWHVWSRHGGRGIHSKKLVLSTVRARVVKATGKPTKKQREDYEFCKLHINTIQDNKAREEAHRRMLASHEKDFMLGWTSEIFDVIYELLPDHINVPIRVLY